jgi:GNAT superfamily N-acetyltransferase
MRVELEDWLAALGVKQWDQGEVGLAEVARQVADGEWYVASRGEALLGALRLLWSDEPVWEKDNAFAACVHGLMVSRQHTGAGIGKALISWAEEQARARSAPALRLDCVETNTRLRLYYESLGFHEVGRRDFDGPWYSAALFEKRLRPES